MTEIVGKRTPKLDWYIFPNQPITGELQSRKNGAPYELPAGSEVWLVVEGKCYSPKRFNPIISGTRIVFIIPEVEAKQIPNLASFRIYLRYPAMTSDILWRVGKGVRSGW